MRVYPRVCGGTCHWGGSLPELGLARVYPRVCGGTAFMADQLSCPGLKRVYPRVCGGTLFRLISKLAGSIPGSAGNRFRETALGSIPACAGEPLARMS